MQLSDRLKCVADCVSPGNIAADVGCDHAYTSIYLVKNNISPHVYAMDINDGPVLRALDNVRLYNCENSISVMKADGLEGIKPEYGIKSVIISGMGGNLMTDILEKSPWAHDECGELILQPQSEVWKVRRWLHDNGYAISHEDMVYEDSKYYVVIKAVRGSECYEEDWEYIYGRKLADDKNKVFVQYLSDNREKNTRIINDLDKVGNKTLTQIGCIESIKNKNRMIEHVLNIVLHE
ncbi:MAG: SAM-dependent methyltransferase [Lachnospiraceae bacterium]|nr:SAM-dependent methyltransferase [Lachnospiraceae bacterium]